VVQQGSTVGASSVRRRTRQRRAQSTTTRLSAMVVAGAVLVALAGGCAGEPASSPIAVRDAPASPAKLSLPKPAKGGLVPGPKWPHACDLVSPADVQAILPEASGIEHRGLEAEFEVVEGRNLARLREIKVPQRSCQIEFDLPHPEEEASSALRSATIQVQLDAVGSPKIAQMNYNALGDLVEGSGADECRTLADTNYNCRAGGVVFTVDGSAAPDLVFQGQQGEATTFYGHRVLQEFVKLIAAKVSPVAS
jgi:hypothetical protein